MNLIFALLFSIPSFAYIPDYHMITSRAAEQHGKGIYSVEQLVMYRRNLESLTVKETWLVSGEDSLRVTLEGKGSLNGLVHGTIVFGERQKYFIDSSSPSVRSQRLGDDWLEPLLYFRSSKYFRNRLVQLQIAPQESLRERGPINSGRSTPPSYLRLSRVGGAVTWAIGNNTSSPTQPTAWIEQDQFLLRKLRNSTQALMRANDYIKYTDEMWFPRQRFINYGEHSVEIITLKVKSLGKQNPKDKSFQSSGLTADKDSLRLPEAEGLKEFYSRFR